MTPEMESYVKAARERGMSDDAIRSALANMGWQQGDIEAAIGFSTAPMPPAAPAAPAASPGRSIKPILVGALVLLLIVAGGTAYAFFLKGTPVPAVVEETGSSLPENPATTTPASTPSRVTTTAPNVTSTPTAIKVGAVIATQTNYQGNALRVLVTCSVGTALDVYGFTLYPGDGSLKTFDSINPVAKTKIFDVTYKAAGQYTLACVPVYDRTTAISQSSPYAGKKVITLGSYAPPAGNSITFNFQPRSGAMPVNFQTNCSINTTGKVIGISVGVDEPSYLAPGQSFVDKYVAFNLDNENGVSRSVSAQGAIQSDFWKGQHNVYCAVQIEGQSEPMVSSPIPINFQ